MSKRKKPENVEKASKFLDELIKVLHESLREELDFSVRDQAWQQYIFIGEAFLYTLRELGFRLEEILSIIEFMKLLLYTNYINIIISSKNKPLNTSNYFR